MTSSAPVAVEVSGLHKSFKLPTQRALTLKERAVHPLTRQSYRELKVLEDISFEIKRGEFFGVVGRNGSGKSTLLKLIASVYRADRGRIRVAGLVAPVIELGVGFQGELTARENILLNALMMGLSAHEARRRFDAVIEFAELQDFVDLKLMNYSSGMRARLAFAIAMQTDPDVLLLDEVLAVGDPPFQRRCRDAFEEIKRDGDRTVLLVTHSMAYIETYCDRAMLLEGGRIVELGEPAEIGRRYRELQPTSTLGAPAAPEEAAEPPPEPPAPQFGRSPTRVSAMRLVSGNGEPVDSVGRGRSIRLHTSVRASATVVSPRLLLSLTDEAGAPIFVPPRIDLEAEADRLSAGVRVDVRIRIENRLAPGRYTISSVVATGPYGDDALVSDPRSLRFEVEGDPGGMKGPVSLDYSVAVEGVATEEHPLPRAGRRRGSR